MQDDERCCGTGTCIIDAQGRCWCGQQWDGEKMCQPQVPSVDASVDYPVEVTDDERPQRPDSP
jgi:hypothetical protein